MNDFWKENDLVGSQGDLRALGHPQRPRQAQLRRVQQVPVMIIKIWHVTCLYAIFQRQIDLKRSQPDTGWSRCSRTPSATSTSSTMVSSASTTYVHQKLTWHMFICYFSKTNRFKRVSAWYSVIKMLSDTLSDLDKLNHGEFSKSQLWTSKFDMAHVYILFFKDKLI